MSDSLPKKIWFLWLQGINSAPVVVKKCYESWIKHNPNWELILVDKNSISEYIPFKLGNITKQALSDILRIHLLAQHGGVWVDATCFCMKPLDDWLYDNMNTGFFAFNKPAPDRMIASWFIASEKYNYLAITYQKMVNSYWAENPKFTFIEDSGWRFLNKKLFKMNTQVWFSPLVINTLKVYPYFWFHYMFANIYLRLKPFREQWDNTPKISADIPHSLQLAGLLNLLTEEIKNEIDNKNAPLYKLTWKYDTNYNTEGTILAYLLST